jgi:hypothetical protein
VAALAGGLAFVMSGFYSWPALIVGAIGLVLLWAGLVRGSTATVTTGAFGVFIAAITAGSQSAPVIPVLASIVLAVVAWDTGGNAISIGNQLGRSANTIRIEIVHIGATLIVGVLTAGVGYAIYLFGTGDQPVVAVVFLLLGAVLLIATLD